MEVENQIKSKYRLLEEIYNKNYGAFTNNERNFIFIEDSEEDLKKEKEILNEFQILKIIVRNPIIKRRYLRFLSLKNIYEKKSADNSMLDEYLQYSEVFNNYELLSEYENILKFNNKYCYLIDDKDRDEYTELWNESSKDLKIKNNF